MNSFSGRVLLSVMHAKTSTQRGNHEHPNLLLHGSGPAAVNGEQPSPDTMYRVFEKGLVLANPSREPRTFDLRSITPARQYLRIMATEYQDSAVNNGQAMGDIVILGERDALFLVRTR
jgi:hypothetical protein